MNVVVPAECHDGCQRALVVERVSGPEGLDELALGVRQGVQYVSNSLHVFGVAYVGEVADTQLAGECRSFVLEAFG